PDHPDLARTAEKILEVADSLIAQFSSVHQVQSELSGDAFSDWNLKAGRIDSGRQWKTLLGYTNDDLDDSISSWRTLLQQDDLRNFDAVIAEHVRDETGFFQVD
ncbi:hypothetical protein JZU71_03830, partial [bacterium]|nr:hypothetical protein [bacterium]